MLVDNEINKIFNKMLKEEIQTFHLQNPSSFVKYYKEDNHGRNIKIKEIDCPFILELPETRSMEQSPRRERIGKIKKDLFSPSYFNILGKEINQRNKDLVLHSLEINVTKNNYYIHKLSFLAQLKDKRFPLRIDWDYESTINKITINNFYEWVSVSFEKYLINPSLIEKLNFGEWTLIDKSRISNRSSGIVFTFKQSKKVRPDNKLYNISLSRENIRTYYDSNITSKREIINLLIQAMNVNNILFKWRTGGGGHRKWLIINNSEKIAELLNILQQDEYRKMIDIEKIETSSDMFFVIKFYLPEVEINKEKFIIDPKNKKGYIIGKQGWKIKIFKQICPRLYLL